MPGIGRSWKEVVMDPGPLAERDLFCHRCGAQLLGDPDDAPDGGVDRLPLCGECVRNRDEAADLAMMDLRDGELDGIIDW
jgi:hypothetical protein